MVEYGRIMMAGLTVADSGAMSGLQDKITASKLHGAIPCKELIWQEHKH